MQGHGSDLGLDLSKMYKPAAEVGVAAVVGFDFGTAFSACAIALTSDGGASKETFLVPLDTESAYSKTVTAVAINEQSKHVVAFGSDCLGLTEDTSAFVFYRFKMSLYQSRSRVTSMPTAEGKTLDMDILELMGSVLAFVKRKVLAWMELRQGMVLDAARIRWVLTVPAIWTDGAKQLMRAAAKAAGLIDDASSWRLLLALEPECAAVEAHSKVTHLLCPDTHFAVMDCGGGTIDTTSFEVKASMPQLQLHQRTAPGGGAWGSTVIDDDLASVVQRLVRLGGWPAERKFDGSAEMSLRDRWEKLKRTYRSGSALIDHATNTRRLPLSDEISELEGASLPRMVAAFNESKSASDPLLQAYRSSLVLSDEAMQLLYKRCLDMITAHVEFLLTKTPVRSASVLVLAGGFAACSLLKEMVRQQLATHVGAGAVTVVEPDGAELLVVRGAVKFGMVPAVVTIRACPATYGVAAAIPYDAEAHGRRPTVRDPVSGQRLVRNVLRPLIKKGELVELGRAITRTYLPTREDQTEVRIRIYAAYDDGAVFIDHPSVTRVAEVKIPIRPGSGVPLADRDVRVTLTFGATQLCVECQSFQGEYENVECRHSGEGAAAGVRGK